MHVRTVGERAHINIAPPGGQQCTVAEVTPSGDTAVTLAKDIPSNPAYPPGELT